MDEQTPPPPGMFRIFTDDGPHDISLKELSDGDQVLIAYLGSIAGTLERLAGATEALATASVEQVRQGNAMASSMGAMSLLAKGPGRG